MAKLNSQNNRDERVLIFAPVGRDAVMAARFLSQAALAGTVCDDSEALCREMASGCGLVLLTGEALTPEAMRDLTAVLGQQPPWSEIPLVVLTNGGGEMPADASTLVALGEVANVTLVERPVRGATLMSTIQSALRARRHQYDVRDYLAKELHTKEALGQSEERLRIALNAAQLGAWQLDLATGRFECTPLCKAHFGLAPNAEFSYDVFLEVIHPDERVAVGAALERARREPSGYEHTDYRAEYRVFWPDGSLHWILTSGRADYDANGAPYNMVGVTLDITERKRAEAEREQLLAREQAARAEAEAANRLKDEFLATVSHELRTPLTALLGWVGLLRRGSMAPEAVAHALDVIERSAQAEAQLVEDILEASRIIGGTLDLDIAAVDLVEVAAAAVETLRPAAAAKAIQLSLQHQAKPCLVAADPRRLQQVIGNLLVNAIKFTPEQGFVEVRLEPLESQVEIRVSDTGQGISSDFLPYIFERFRQANSSATREHGGLGLGLAIVRHLVELQGGTVQAQSPGVGQGATFIVCLPLLTVQPSINLPAAAPQEQPPGLEAGAGADKSSHGSVTLKGLRVLVVDNDATMRELIATVLKRYGAVVTSAGSAVEAMQAIEESRPDVLLSDIGMPGEDGYQLIRNLRDQEKQRGEQPIPAAALTAYAGRADQAFALSCGFQLHVPKPFEADTLVAAVTSLARREVIPPSLV